MDDKEFGTDILTLVDDNGNEHEFEIADTLEIDDQQYMALIPLVENDDLDDPGELLVLRVVESDGEEYLEPIDNEDEFTRVADIFMERLDDMFDFIDEDEVN